MLCNRCGRTLSNTSENKIENYLITQYPDYYHEEAYERLIQKANKEQKQDHLDNPQWYDENIDTWFEINEAFGEEVWICPDCKTMHIFSRETHELKDIYWRLPRDEWRVSENDHGKHFYEWTARKKQLHDSKRLPTIKEGEVWWCGLGENVGIEINGKNAKYSRPALVLKKLSRDGFMCVPLTSQAKSGSWYVEFDFLNKKQFAALSQARVISVNRLYNKMGTVPASDLEKVRNGFIALYK